jgi:hypothetical protein
MTDTHDVADGSRAEPVAATSQTPSSEPPPSRQAYSAAIGVAVTILNRSVDSVRRLEQQMADKSPVNQVEAWRAKLDIIKGDLQLVLDLLRPLEGPFRATSSAPATASGEPSVASKALQEMRLGLGSVTTSLERARSALERYEQLKPSEVAGERRQARGRR